MKEHDVTLTLEEEGDELMFMRSQLQKVFTDQPVYLCISTMAAVIEDMLTTESWVEQPHDQRKLLAIPTLEVLEVLQTRIKEHFQLS